MSLKYERILLKLSGESLMGTESFGYSKEAVDKIVQEVLSLHKTGAEIAIVVGGGNIFRGRSLAAHGVDPATADYMGMTATLQNALFLRSVFDKQINEDKMAQNKQCDKEDTYCRVMSAITVNELAEGFSYQRALKHLRKKNIVILAAGLGSPFFTTDTAAVQRAKELDCDLVIKATKIDGVYDKDPAIPGAKKLDKVSYEDAITNRLGVMDATAFTFCQDFNIPIVVCDVMGVGNLKGIAEGKAIGTLVSG